MTERAVRFICGSEKPDCSFYLQSDDCCAILYLFIEAAVHSCIKFYIRERFKIRKRGAAQSVCDGEHKSSESKSTGKIG